VDPLELARIFIPLEEICIPTLESEQHGLLIEERHRVDAPVDIE
jgi:hypothetical protein